MDDPQDLSLLELLRPCLSSNDNALWQEFVRRIHSCIAGTIVRTFHRYGRPHSPSLVDDLVQETYIKLFANNCRALREFQADQDIQLYGFIKTVARNVAIDYLRQSIPDEEDLDKIGPVLPAPSINPDRQILLDQIIGRFNKLKDEPNFKRDLTIFLFYYVHGLTAKAISPLPGINLTVKGVESVLLRLIRFLRGELRDHGLDR